MCNFTILLSYFTQLTSKWYLTGLDLLLQKCLMGLLSQKTVIYTTHQLEFLDAADLVVVSRKGLKKLLLTTTFRNLLIPHLL